MAGGGGVDSTTTSMNWLLRRYLLLLLPLNQGVDFDFSFLTLKHCMDNILAIYGDNHYSI